MTIAHIQTPTRKLWRNKMANNLDSVSVYGKCRSKGEILPPNLEEFEDDFLIHLYVAASNDLDLIVSPIARVTIRALWVHEFSVRH